MEIFIGLISVLANKYTLVISTLAVVSLLLFVFFRVCGTLQRYVLREVFSTFLVALAALVLITFLGLGLKLLSAGLNIIHMPIIVPFLILFSLPFAIPAALLTAVVMTCGRMSSDNEITAIRSSGVHLYLVVTPIVLCGALMSIFALALNGWALPAAHLEIEQLREKAIVAFTSSYARSAENSLKIPGSAYTIYWSSLDSETQIYHNVVIIESEGTTMTRYVVAEEGRIEFDEKAGVFLVRLTNCRIGHLDYKASATGNRDKTLDSLSTGKLESFDYFIPVNSSHEQRVREFDNMPLERLYAERKERRKKLISRGKPLEHPDRELKRREKDYQQVSQKKKNASAAVKKAKEEKSSAQARAKMAKTRIEELQQSIANLEKDMEFLDRQVKTHDVDRKASAKELEQRERELGKLEEKRRRLGDQKANLASLDKAISELKERIEKLEAQKRRSERSYEESQAQFGACTTKLRKAEASLKQDQKVKKRSTEEEKKADEIIREKGRSAEEYNKERQEVLKKIERAKEQVAEREIAIEIQKRLAMSFASLAFVLVGAPLGIMAKHGNVLIGFGISFILAYFLYYPLFMTGELLAAKHYLPAATAMWLGNVIFGIIGIAFLRVVFKR